MGLIKINLISSNFLKVFEVRGSNSRRSNEVLRMIHQVKKTSIVPNVKVELMPVFVHVTCCLVDEKWYGIHVGEVDDQSLGLRKRAQNHWHRQNRSKRSDS